MTQQNKNGILYFVAGVFLSVVLTFSIVSFSGILRGKTGDRGLPGNNGVYDYSSVQNTLSRCETIWATFTPEQKLEYDDDENRFYAAVLTGGVNLDIANNDIVSATNSALRSTVDIMAFFGSTTMYGGGVIYQLDRILNPAVGVSGHVTGLPVGSPIYHGYIVTNYHVICKYVESQGLMCSADIYVRLLGAPKVFETNGTNTYYDCIPAYVVGGSAEYDIAILEINKNGKELTDVIRNTNTPSGWLFPSKTVNAAFEERYNSNPNQSAILPLRGNASFFATSHDARYSLYTEPKYGSDVIAIGNPLGNGMNVTVGVVSKESHYINLPPLDETRTDYDRNRVIQIDPGINSGNSGGGLFDVNGKWVGIVQARLYGADGTVASTAYAVPVSIAARIAEQIIAKHQLPEYLNADYGHPIPVTMRDCGITVTSKASAKVKYENGVMILYETVTVKGRVAGLVPLVNVDDQISSVRVNKSAGYSPYAIDHMYTFEEIMFEAVVYEVEITFKRPNNTNYTVVFPIAGDAHLKV
jgi:S1-C subfamily serine protease